MNIDDTENILWDLMENVNKLNIDDIITCNCGSSNIIKDDNLFTCQECYNIVDNVIDCSAEWRYYNGDDNKSEDPSRCGLPTNHLLPKSSLGSIVGRGPKDTKELHCVRKLQTWTSMPYYERKLLNVFEKFSNSTNNTGISPKVLYDAKIMYKKVSSMKISRGNNNEGLIASCVYYACIINKTPRSIKEISDMFNITPIVLTKGNSRFQKLNPMNVLSISPQDFISRFGSKLNLSRSHIDQCVDFTNFLEINDIISDNSPTSTAAGIICYFCYYKKIDILKKYIANICGVSEVTVTKSLKNISKYDKIINIYLLS
jgi:transcription initiation factor TFIIB